MLGPKQKTWLKDRLLRSTARWKFFVTSVPFNPTSKPRDSWGAYVAERTELVDFIKANGIAGVVIISGDVHLGGAIDNGTNSDFPEMNVPFANPGFADMTAHGIWSEGFIPGARHPGFGLFEVSQDAVDMHVIGYDGSERLHYTVTQ